MKIRLDRNQLLDLQITLKKEYLLTNGRGGYCSSTVLDCHTRKYHGMLVAPVNEQNNRLYVFLSKLETNAIIDGKEFHLSTNKFPGIFNPTGHKYTDSFEFENIPVTTYRIGDTTIIKSILMVEGEDTVLIRYDLVSSEKPVSFQATPLLAFRDYHQLSHENLDFKNRTYFEENGFKIDPYRDVPPMWLQTSVKSTFYPSPSWWKNFELLKERNRGYNYQEDLFSPGIFELTLNAGDSVVFRASLHPKTNEIEDTWKAEMRKIRDLNDKYRSEPEPLQTLKIHAQDYLVTHPDGSKGIIAGYHWFGEWGRDTLISLPGLTLHRGDPETAFNILEKFTHYEKNGLLPNIVSDDGNHAYNSIDTPLLYFRAVQQYLASTGNRDRVEQFFVPTLVKIAGNISSDNTPWLYPSDHGLIYSGNENTNLTWMDAMVWGQPVTPRNGAAVEINALWYNAMQFLLQEFPDKVDNDLKEKLWGESHRFEENFEKRFWHEQDQCLVDLYKDDYNRQNFIRPNQLFAIGLPYTCISQEKANIILQTIGQHLVTPYGLRTLSPRNPLYKFEYNGAPEIRDAAYHMGMVWPWLIGIYMDAARKVWNNDEAVKNHIVQQFNELWTLHLDKYGLFHISELFRPNPPYVAKACIAQAWSDAELIRVMDTLKI